MNVSEDDVEADFESDGELSSAEDLPTVTPPKKNKRKAPAVISSPVPKKTKRKFPAKRGPAQVQVESSESSEEEAYVNSKEKRVKKTGKTVDLEFNQKA